MPIPEQYVEEGVPVNAERYADFCVAEERERIAKIVEAFTYEDEWLEQSGVGMAELAAKIRSLT